MKKMSRLLHEGNLALRSGDYSTALERYRKLGKSTLDPALHEQVEFNSYLAAERAGITSFGTDFHLSGPTKRLEDNYDVVLNCWLRNPEPIQDAMVDLYQHLRSRGLTVLMTTHSKSLLQNPSVETLEADFSLTNATIYGSLPDKPMPNWLESELLEVILARFRHLNRPDLIAEADKFRGRVRKAYHYWRRFLKANNPALLAVWGTTCAISRLQVALCNELSIPYIVLERGHFENSITADNGGQRAHRAVNLTPKSHEYTADFYSEIETWIKENSEPPYAASNADTTILEEIQQKRDQGYQQVIVFIGSNDNGSGVAYESPYITERHSKWVFTSGQAAELVKAARMRLGDDTLVVLKPHPIDRYDYSQLVDEGILLADTSNVNALIAAADACVTTSTTAIAQCIVLETPTVSVALSEFSTRGILYECESQADLTRKIRAALTRQDYENKVRAGQNFLCEMFGTGIFLLDEHPRFLSMRDLSGTIASRVTSFLRPREEAFSLGTRAVPQAKNRQLPMTTLNSIPTKARRRLTVVVPVYRGVEETRECLEAACREIEQTEDAQLVVINDASPDDAMPDLLETISKHPRVSVLTNDQNLGFVASVNVGIETAGDDDVVILNSDALLSPGSLNALAQGAYSDPKIATATPFSNNASIYSLPRKGSPLSLTDGKKQVALMAEAVRSLPPIVVEMPVGHGFCMFIRRSALNAVGAFDEISFGRGYSEEVDFCLRSRTAGLVNVLVSQAFVGHIGGVSFAETGDKQRTDNQRIINSRYPNYFSEIKAFTRSDPIEDFRNIALSEVSQYGNELKL